MKKHYLVPCFCIWFCITLIGVILCIISMAKSFETKNEIEKYCDDILTTCNMSVTGNGDFTQMWYVMDVPNAQHCRYKGDEKLDSGWKLIDCHYDSEVSNCPSVECESTELQEKLDNGQNGLFWSGVVLGIVGCLIMTIFLVFDLDEKRKRGCIN